jgi:RNA polymerase sigma-70 factor (ECF subfamily)
MDTASSVSTHYQAIYRFIRKRSGSREDAEDLTQEVFAAAVVALQESRLREAEPSLAWLYTVARRRLTDRLRTNRPLAHLDAEVPAPELAYDSAVVASLVGAVNELEPLTRQVIVLKLFEGRTFKEIAPKLNLSEQACRTRFSRGLATLRHQLEQKGVQP